MRLRRQLILVSLLTLSLPWAGCQYIQEMERALRQGQVVALGATAQAVASRIASEPRLLALAEQPRWQADPSRQLYLHPLTSPVQLDGYDDDWRSSSISPRQFTATDVPGVAPVSLSLRLARQQDAVLLFAYVEDADIRYHHPGTGLLASGDHLRLRTRVAGGGYRDYVIRSGAPGDVSAYYRDDQQRIRQEQRIVGEWQEHGRGFQLELSVPLSLLGDTLGVALVDRLPGVDTAPPQPLSYDDEVTFRNTPAPARWVGNIQPQEPPPYWSSEDDSLAAAVGVFARDDLRLQVVSRNHWLLVNAGSLRQPAEYSQPPPANGQHALILWLYRLALGNEALEPLASYRETGRVTAAEIDSVLAGEPVQAWYQWGKQRVGRAAVPVVNGAGEAVAVVLAEQSSDTVLALTNAAFNRLFFYTLLATGITGLGLLTYASWLSLRIRRLSRAAANAIDDNGRISDSFPRSAAADEVGDLTRNYGALLARLQEYTDYLRTLSGKLSHELRTPLAMVRSSLDNLEHEPLPASALRYAQRAQEGSARLSNILNAMSSASRVEESIRHAELENFSLSALLQSLGAAYGDMLASQQLRVTVDHRAAPAMLRGSPDLLVQMLDKLVENAADFCPPGGVIALQLAEAPAHWLLIVSNDGPLLPEQMQGQLFDSLVSVRSGRSDKTHLGLGLHIVRLIVQFHRGRVHARNRSDLRGVEFVVQLPKAAA